ncbi:GspH/FimT family pseudopilin [Solilutibacter silvestris]|uniref:GspH/FimT family pseudopilin n=1 Tax=Solilutibacter silvestris TaxID=1645665 RepID=UPI0013FDBEB7|nr:GspH/FimT family pseudopilin [Lysobacter silvestris]
MSPRQQQGFTLIEIVLVMALVALATALVASTISRNSGGQRLRDAAQQIAMGLRQARTEAMRSQLPQRFVLEPQQHRWAIVGRNARPLDPDLEVTMESGRELAQNAQQGVIVFFPDGASTGGRVTLARNGQRWRSDVNWITGEVTLQRDGAP